MTTKHGRELSAQEMARMLDEWVNAHHYDDEIKAFAQHVVHNTHRTLQQGIMRLFIATIATWASEGRSDLRNESTIKMSKKIVAALGDKIDMYLPYI